MRLYQFSILFCLVKLCFSHVGTGIGKGRYDVYYDTSVIDFDTRPGQFSPDVDYCIALANSLHSSNGVMYNDGINSCIVLTSYNNEIVIKLRIMQGWTTYVKDIIGQQKMVLKFETTWSSEISSTFPYYVWLGMIPVQNNYSSRVASLEPGSGCNCTYRNDFIPYTSYDNLQAIHLKSYSQGKLVGQFVFSGSGASYLGPFSKNNLIGTMPYNLQTLRSKMYSTGTFNPFSDQCEPPTQQYGRFFNWFEGGETCQDNRFYMFATNEVAPCGCSYTSGIYPKLFYSATQDSASTNSLGLLSADYLVVYYDIIKRAYYV